MKTTFTVNKNELRLLQIAICTRLDTLAAGGKCRNAKPNSIASRQNEALLMRLNDLAANMPNEDWWLRKIERRGQQ
jgi:hypothetical protein